MVTCTHPDTVTADPEVAAFEARLAESEVARDVGLDPETEELFEISSSIIGTRLSLRRSGPEREA